MMRRLPLLFVTAAAGRPNLQTGSARGVQTTSAHGVGRPRVTRNVSDTAGLHAAMDDVSVNEIVAANGTYRLADEPGLGCMAPAPYYGDYFLCIGRDLTIRAAAGETAVLDGGGKRRVLYIYPGVTATLHGLRITNGSTTWGGYYGGGLWNQGTLSLNNCSVDHCLAGNCMKQCSKGDSGGAGGGVLK